ncbi:MAG: hypothetical protein GY750_14385 [Lentisphaerae bacterium]|nr:hypothetical protein [Lentisphaerota bacterium]MCP4102589.1 hypothetical protein [Lentisphaerota bacterium]
MKLFRYRFAWIEPKEFRILLHEYKKRKSSFVFKLIVFAVSVAVLMSVWAVTGRWEGVTPSAALLVSFSFAVFMNFLILWAGRLLPAQILISDKSIIRSETDNEVLAFDQVRSYALNEYHKYIVLTLFESHNSELHRFGISSKVDVGALKGFLAEKGLRQEDDELLARFCES